MQVLSVIQIILGAYLVGSGFLSHDVEALVHILRGECTRFYVIIGETRVYPVLKHLLYAYFSTVFCHISFVANDYDGHLWLIHLIIALRLYEIVPPGGDAFIALHVVQVEHNHAAISTSVESVGETLEPFLASSVPNLQRHLLPRIKGHNFFHEVSADRWSLNLVDLFVLEALDQSCLADVRVTYHNHF